jgi:hypothetical protein
LSLSPQIAYKIITHILLMFFKRANCNKKKTPWGNAINHSIKHHHFWCILVGLCAYFPDCGGFLQFTRLLSQEVQAFSVLCGRCRTLGWSNYARKLKPFLFFYVNLICFFLWFKAACGLAVLGGEISMILLGHELEVISKKKWLAFVTVSFGVQNCCWNLLWKLYILVGEHNLRSATAFSRKILG